MPAEGGVPQPPHLHRHARPRRRVRPHGAEQHRHGLDARRQTHRLPLAHAGRSTTSSASSIPCPLDGGLPEELPLPRGGFCSYSPDGKKLAYNRVFREFRTWKRYRGGMADDVWIYDFERKTEDRPMQRSTDERPTSPQNIIPDVERRQDLFPLRPRRRQADEPLRPGRRRQEGASSSRSSPTSTSSSRRWATRPSSSRTAAGSTASTWTRKRSRKCRSASSKTAPRAHRAGCNVSKNVTEFEISPDGKRALFGARGEVFTVPAKTGPTRNLTNTSGAHERNAKWSPDGKWIAFVSDADGEDEIYVAPQDGKEPAQQLTDKGDTYKYEISWSPDSKKILWTDKKLRLQYVDVDTKAVTAGDAGEGVGDPRRRLVAGQPLDRLLAAGGGRAEPRLPVLAGTGQDLRRHRPLVRLARPGLQRRRQIPVLRLRPRLQPDLQRHGIELRLQGHGPDLSRHCWPRTRRRRSSRKSDEVEEKKAAEAKDEPKKDEPKKDAGDQGRYRRSVGARRGSCPCSRRTTATSHRSARRSTTSARAARTPSRRFRCTTWPAQGDGPRLRRRLRDLRRRQEDDRVAGRQVRHHRPAERPGDGRASRSTCPAWR